MVSKDVLTVFFAGLAALFGGLAVMLGARAYQVSKITLAYMRGRDLEVDTRTGWIEIHKAMVNLRVQRTLVMLQRGAMGAYSSSAPNPFEERVRDYVLATAQLRGQLDRLNDDPLILELAKFLDDNKLMDQWQMDEYEKQFDAFAQSVAMKSRPR
jgi:hypothetical protein